MSELTEDLTHVARRKHAHARALAQESESRTSGDESGDSGHEEEKSGGGAEDSPPTTPTTPSPTSSLLSPPPDDQASTLTDVSLEVKPGELVCVYGPTGCGKSSLLLSLLGEVRRVEGTVEVRAQSETLGGGLGNGESRGVARIYATFKFLVTRFSCP